MKITTSPRFVVYTDYSDCTIKEALLHALQNSKDKLLTLPQIGNIRVNGNRLLGSYGKAIQNLNKQGYRIPNKMELIDGIMCSTYRLENPTHNPDDSENFNNI